MQLSRIRKAIVAFVAPIAGLPLLAWLNGSVEFNLESALMAISTGLIQGYLVWRVPNAE